MVDVSQGREAAAYLTRALGRRGFLQAAAAMGAVTTLGACTSSSPGATAAGSSNAVAPLTGTTPLQPDSGDVTGDVYLASTPDEVLWGYVPSVHATPVRTMRSGQTITIDALSHEGILEDQGRDPVEYFGSHGVEPAGVLEDAVAVAADYRRTPRNFDVDGPHVVTGPVFVEGAVPGDVLKIETLEAVPRVPYGVVSSRHGKGALPLLPDGTPAPGLTLDQVMPAASADNRASGNPMEYGNVSIFTPIENDQGVMGSGDVELRFPLRVFMGMMGVAYADTTELTAPELNSIPPTLGGGNIDIRHLGVGSSFYLPVRAEGALFYVGDPHLAMADAEVALTAMEGSVRGTFRLTVCKPGSGDAPSVAYRYPFAETPEYWIPVGLSDPDGAGGGQNTSDLDIAMRQAVVNALDFLEHDKGLDRQVAYAYLSVAADFALSQVVDRTVGVHGLIRKADFHTV